MLLTELKDDFQFALRREFTDGEQLLWWAQPDADAIARSILPYSVIWLSGLFLMSVAMLLDNPGDAAGLRGGLIFLLVIVAVAGVIELIFVPRRAERTLYAVTNYRALMVLVTKKIAPDEFGTERKVIREDPSTPQNFYLSNLPAQILLLLAGSDVIRALSHKVDLFLVAGFGLVLVGWMRPWVNEMRLPLAKFREAPRMLYSVEDMFVVLQSMPRPDVGAVKLRRIGKELFNIFVISNHSGVIRFKAVAGIERAQSLPGILLGLPNDAREER